jgi:hypothetical protein
MATERLGAIPALLLGALQEASDGLKSLLGGGPLLGRNAISTADMLANLYGIRRASPMVASITDLIAGGDAEPGIMAALRGLIQTEEK